MEQIDIRKYYDEKTKVITMPKMEFRPHPDGFGCLLFQCMKEHGDKIAQIDAATGAEDKYSSLFQRCIRTAIEIQNRGITKNDIICLCSENQLNSSVPFLAALFLGIKVCSLDPTSSLEDCVHFIKNVKPKILFVSSESEELIEKAVKTAECKAPLIIHGGSSKNPSFEEFLKPKINENQFEPTKAKKLTDIVLIVSSSGTTGLPKAILFSHEFMLLHGQPQDFKVDKVLAFASLFWVSQIFSTVMCILAGTSKMVASKYEPTKTWEIVEKFQVSLLFLTPFDSVALIRNRPKEIMEKCSLKMLAIAGSFIAEEHLLKAREVLPNTLVLHAYGQTELPNIFELNISMMLSKYGCMGIPGKGREYKIVDTDTEKNVGFNEKGELRVKTKYCLSGFYNRDCSDVFDKDGFLKTGDVAYFDNEFGFFIVDRIKEMFKYKTYHIVPVKVEAILLTHPAVAVGVVVGLPHQEDDNHVMAVVQLVEGSNATSKEIEDYVNSRVEDDRYKLRAGCKIITDMPRTPSGKIRRMAVRDMFRTDK